MDEFREFIGGPLAGQVKVVRGEVVTWSLPNFSDIADGECGQYKYVLNSEGNMVLVDGDTND